MINTYKKRPATQPNPEHKKGKSLKRARPNEN